MFRAASNWRTGFVACALAGWLSGCNGQISTPAPEGSWEPERPTGAGGSTGGRPATDPGRITLHRLNSAEYNNTVQDLFGTALRPADTFPVDDRGDGFDNIASVLSLSPLHLSMYQSAAAKLADEALSVPAQRARLVSCDLATGEACARTALTAFLPRAWRRPVESAEIDKYLAFVTLAKSTGDSYEAGFSLAVQAALLSPNFVFRVEVDPAPASTAPHPVGSFELASRLSYFLWSTMPDDQLFAAAKAGTLTDPTTLKGEVARMMASNKAQALVDNFAGQWLYTRKVDEATPDAKVFPSFDEPLRAAMKTETQLLFREIAFGGLPANQLLTADFAYANDRLIKHYGLPLPGGAEFKKIPVTPSDHRGGLLGQAGLLTVTSHPARTSPVLRGKWILTELLCKDIPPPPPDVNIKLEDGPAAAGKTVRERLEAHVQNARCASCHRLMDPIGFGLENYDAIGAYRTMDGDSAVDSRGLLNGNPFNGLTELATLISADPEFSRCTAQKLYTYALGRAPELEDSNHLDATTLASIADAFVKGGYKFADLVAGVVTSRPFLERRGDPTGAPGAKP
ncbi:MAG TPA: DUF1592 domain-containing protein [Polyangiaceae bacterium]|nr:DUF1592 domain-containing protein [Polyangiaceae bacterium]